jgi:hypothetical protein
LGIEGRKVEENNIRNLPRLCFDTLQNQRFSKISEIVTVHNPKKTHREKESKRSCGSAFPWPEYIQRRSQISRASGSEWYPATTERKKTTKIDAVNLNWPSHFYGLS